jgi:hypothetical protein
MASKAGYFNNGSCFLIYQSGARLFTEMVHSYLPKWCIVIYRSHTSEDITISERYVSKYPAGKYISKAIARQSQLEILNQQKAYDVAASQNTSYSWKKFLEDYLNHN